jgi:hypothetical protein
MAVWGRRTPAYEKARRGGARRGAWYLYHAHLFTIGVKGPIKGEDLIRASARVMDRHHASAKERRQMKGRERESDVCCGMKYEVLSKQMIK